MKNELRTYVKTLYLCLPSLFKELKVIDALRRRVSSRWPPQNRKFIRTDRVEITDSSLDNFVGYALFEIGENSNGFYDYLTSAKVYDLYGESIHPKDPFSKDYFDFQMDLYRRISGKDYSLELEKSEVIPSECLREPYKYLGFNPKLISNELQATSLLLRELDTNPGEKFIECGSGRGIITEQLCLSNLDLTVIEIDSNFCKIIKKR